MSQERIRVSIGTASLLGLAVCRQAVPPTTAYLLSYVGDKCAANCAFCPQARESGSKTSHLSRIEWPTFRLKGVIEAISHNTDLQRVCLQSLNFPLRYQYVSDVIGMIGDKCSTPISLCTPPLSLSQMEELHELGLDRICFAVDAAEPELFDRIKGKKAGGPYTWDEHMSALEEAQHVFGPGGVTTHLIQGMGETEESLISLIQRLKDQDILPSLFALTPISGTRMAETAPPAVSSYRRVQAARHLILKGLLRSDDMVFQNGVLGSFGRRSPELRGMLVDGLAFKTSGCPGCNRPFYNESPKGPIYNYPRELTEKEVDEALRVMEVLE